MMKQQNNSPHIPDPIYSRRRPDMCDSLGLLACEQITATRGGDCRTEAGFLLAPWGHGRVGELGKRTKITILLSSQKLNRTETLECWTVAHTHPEQSVTARVSFLKKLFNPLLEVMQPTHHEPSDSYLDCYSTATGQG